MMIFRQLVCTAFFLALSPAQAADVALPPLHYNPSNGVISSQPNGRGLTICGLSTSSGLLKSNGINGCGLAAPSDVISALGYNPLSKAGDTAFGPMSLMANITAPVTGSTFGWLYQSGSVTAESLLANQVPPNWANWDGQRVVMTTPAGTSVRNIVGFNAYGRNTIAQNNAAALAAQGSGGETNMVGYSSGLTCEVAGCATWAMNPTLTDALQTTAVPSGQAYSAKLIGNETDISVRNPGTNVTGFTVLGSSVVQPAFAQFVACGSLGGPALWDECFLVTDGVGKHNGLHLGSIGVTGSPSAPSTTINMNWYAANSTPSAPAGGQIQLQAVLGALNVTDIYKPDGVYVSPAVTGTAPEVGSTGSDTNIDLSLRAKGTGALLVRNPAYVTGSLNASTYIQAPTFIETLTTPASSTSACAAGQFTDDANYHYVCVATNTWKRVALSTF